MIERIFVVRGHIAILRKKKQQGQLPFHVAWLEPQPCHSFPSSGHVEEGMK